MKYIYIDGDNIGLKIEQSFLHNDEETLLAVNEKVKSAISKISTYLIDRNQKIIFAGADGIISKGGNLSIIKLLAVVRNAEIDLTFSVGVGDSLRNCYIALRYAKSRGKDLAVEFFGNSDFVIIRA